MRASSKAPAEPPLKQICIGQQARPRIWAKHGTKSRAPRDQCYEWAYIFGVGCPPRRAMLATRTDPTGTQPPSCRRYR